MKFLKEFDPEDRAYCSIAAAVLGAGALTAGASMYGASKASDAQSAAADKSIANSQQMYAQNKNILSPYINAGYGATTNLQDWTNPNGGSGGSNPLSSLVKLTTPGADMSSVLAQTPGYQFSVNQGTRAIMNSLAGRGLGGSTGAITKGVGDYVTGAAGNQWSSIVNALQGVFGSETNALQGLVSTGANAGGALAGQGTAAAGQINSALTGQGNAQAAGYNAMGSAAGGFGNSVSTAALLQKLIGGGSGGGGGSIYGAAPTMGADGLPAVY